MSKEELEIAVLSLPVEDRASLAHKLIASIDDTPAVSVEEEWIQEADRRAAQVMSGEVEVIAGEEVFRKAFERRRQK
jgi:putative addiction module component (TIGR02574 family)